ncbi:glycine cleavage system aminomethyltransferase GcvT [Demequina sp. SYSU T00068]|uniref:glycine cleavage system aminomethyltransferase GcvT n=1 Tax=Demequina lignilytica TaxID=3051663 RepID=UPI00262955ED|nr:glycine cleavage system aminomethyltransferase GcvT [Demequina sp. SYSU T00068]MDN4491362.1 glycine cleavage system aminomethyltransferase GcvT [Demequina sp. SYSU T00068]
MADAPLRSPLHDEHVALGATLVPFAGWEMPVRYTGDIAEHTAVRTAAGLFDLSHMGEIAVHGDGAEDFLDHALVGRMSAIALGGAKYTMLCTPDGGVIDDLIVYRRDWDHYVIVANAANKDVVVAELESRLVDYDARLEDISAEIALIAVQGPRAERIVAAMCARGDDDIVAMKYYSAANVLLRGDIHAFAARTGYTGEDGFELFVNAADAVAVWRLALETGAPDGLIPCGLSARDTLRLEAGMPLYGQELTRDTTPFEAGLGRIVVFGSAARPRGPFVGHDALLRAKVEGTASTLVGLVGDGRRAARAGYPIVDESGEQVGVVTSGAPSPTLGRPIAMAYVPHAMAEPGTEVAVDVRGRREPMTVTSLPFYRRDS